MDGHKVDAMGIVLEAVCRYIPLKPTDKEKYYQDEQCNAFSKLHPISKEIYETLKTRKKWKEALDLAIVLSQQWKLDEDRDKNERYWSDEIAFLQDKTKDDPKSPSRTAATTKRQTSKQRNNR